MCGIIAVISKSKELNIQVCESALSALHHRGPDYQISKTLESGRLFFGQTVLSITGSPTTVKSPPVPKFLPIA